MVKEYCICLTEIFMTVNLKMENLVEKDILNGHISQDWIIKVNSRMGSFTVQEHCKIWTEFFKVNLKKDFLFENLQDDKEVLTRANARNVNSLKDLTYKNFQPEIEIIDQAFYEIMTEGDSNKQPFTFPIPTVNINFFDKINPFTNRPGTSNADYYRYICRIMVIVFLFC